MGVLTHFSSSNRDLQLLPTIFSSFCCSCCQLCDSWFFFYGPHPCWWLQQHGCKRHLPMFLVSVSSGTGGHLNCYMIQYLLLKEWAKTRLIVNFSVLNFYKIHIQSVNNANCSTVLSLQQSVCIFSGLSASKNNICASLFSSFWSASKFNVARTSARHTVLPDQRRAFFHVHL